MLYENNVLIAAATCSNTWTKRPCVVNRNTSEVDFQIAFVYENNGILYYRDP